ncbi:hypothetical protein A2U01_0085407, partial [Trifolium medium]|nr:hypothetical protein [Trifolium medium]
MEELFNSSVHAKFNGGKKARSGGIVTGDSLNSNIT